MSEIPLGRKLSEQEYAELVEKGEILADKLQSYMQPTDVGFIPPVVIVAGAAGTAAIGTIAAALIACGDRDKK